MTLLKILGAAVFAFGMLSIAVRLFWWAMDFDSFCNLFDEDR